MGLLIKKLTLDDQIIHKHFTIKRFSVNYVYYVYLLMTFFFSTTVNEIYTISQRQLIIFISIIAVKLFPHRSFLQPFF